MSAQQQEINPEIRKLWDEIIEYRRTRAQGKNSSDYEAGVEILNRFKEAFSICYEGGCYTSVGDTLVISIVKTFVYSPPSS